MCLLVLAWQAHPRYSLVVAANRDEFHERPAAPLARWEGPNDIVAGRDLRAGGTWLGIDRHRRFGVVTNFREAQGPKPHAPSRGKLIPDYLSGALGAGDFLAALRPHAPAYSGFNLLLADERELWYASNRAEPWAGRLEPGIYGLSNGHLDAPWPKLLRVRRKFATWLASASELSSADVFAMLDDREPTEPHDSVPRTGLPPDLERALSAPFVVHPRYGTRCSTVVMFERSGALRIQERRFDARGILTGETELALNAS